MRAVLQRVSEASVTVEGQMVGQIGPGLLVLVCAMPGDTPAGVDHLAARIAKLRIFKDTSGKMNLSLRDTGGAALLVSQFTLAADTSRGNRPGFTGAAAPEAGKALYQRFVDAMQREGIPCAQGLFGADMQVSLVNDGPVTVLMEDQHK